MKKDKLIASSSTLQGIQRILNQYFYSTSYQVFPDGLITNSRGQVDGYYCKKEKSRWKLYSKL